MEEEKNIALLFSFYFGTSAQTAQSGASRRFRKWSRAFDEWMEEQRRDYKKDMVKQSVLAWRRLARQCGKMPWEISREDIEQHSAWMEEEGFASSTINCMIGIIASFYQWCDERRVDRACPAGFNPAKEAARIKMRRYAGVNLWSRLEVGALLEMVSRDGSEVGKRDYAFLLARLNLGVPLNSLRQLKWEQIELDEAGVTVRWRQAGERVRLPDPVWQAVSEYLRASGRMKGMREGKYIFAPLAAPGKEMTGGRAEDWLENQQVAEATILGSLKLYGRQLGIAETKLNLMALKRTAIRLKMDEGESLEGMKLFMDSREEFKAMKFRLGRLPEMPGDDPPGELDHGRGVEPPVRRAKPFKLGENTTHGFYARHTDVQAVKAILAENIRGVEQETAWLRGLMRGLLEHHGDDPHLVDVYTCAAHRLGTLVSAAESAYQTESDIRAEEVLSKLDRVAADSGLPPVSPGMRQQALGDSSAGLDASGFVTEEIATIRLLLRNTYESAMQAVDTQAYLRLVDLYGLGCVRLARLLKLGGRHESGSLKRELQESLDEAIRQVHRELSGS